MRYSIREARKQLSHLLNAVEQGEEVEITRRGRVVARLTRPEVSGNVQAEARAAARQALRDKLPVATTSAVDLIRQERDERGWARLLWHQHSRTTLPLGATHQSTLDALHLACAAENSLPMMTADKKLHEAARILKAKTHLAHPNPWLRVSLTY